MTNNSPLVSVITPCYNDGSFINECIESVQNCGYSNIEQIIIDDGSNEETKKILDSICIPGVRIIHKINEGVCIARNVGIKEAKGKYILPIDADDILMPGFVQEAINIFEDNADVRIVTGEITQCFGKSRQKIIASSFDMSLLLARNQVVVSTMFKREDALKVGGFDTTFNIGLEDWDFWISLMSLGGSAIIIPGTHLLYRIKKKSRNNSFGGLNAVNQIRKKIWEKHKELFSQYYVNPMETVEYQYASRTLFMRIKNKILKHD